MERAETNPLFLSAFSTRFFGSRGTRVETLAFETKLPLGDYCRSFRLNKLAGKKAPKTRLDLDNIVKSLINGMMSA